jgi:hypothetical protein
LYNNARNEKACEFFFTTKACGLTFFEKKVWCNLRACCCTDRLPVSQSKKAEAAAQTTAIEKKATHHRAYSIFQDSSSHQILRHT